MGSYAMAKHCYVRFPVCSFAGWSEGSEVTISRLLLKAAHGRLAFCRFSAAAGFASAEVTPCLDQTGITW